MLGGYNDITLFPGSTRGLQKKLDMCPYFGHERDIPFIPLKKISCCLYMSITLLIVNNYCLIINMCMQCWTLAKYISVRFCYRN